MSLQERIVDYIKERLDIKSLSELKSYGNLLWGIGLPALFLAIISNYESDNLTTRRENIYYPYTISETYMKAKLDEKGKERDRLKIEGREKYSKKPTE